MRPKDLPLRDWIALEALSGILAAGRLSAEASVDYACTVADAVLAKMHTYQCRIADAERRAEDAETARQVIFDYKFQGPGFSERVALSEIWDALGVSDQTAAMSIIREYVK